MNLLKTFNALFPKAGVGSEGLSLHPHQLPYCAGSSLGTTVRCDCQQRLVQNPFSGIFATWGAWKLVTYKVWGYVTWAGIFWMPI